MFFSSTSRLFFSFFFLLFYSFSFSYHQTQGSYCISGRVVPPKTPPKTTTTQTASFIAYVQKWRKTIHIRNNVCNEFLREWNCDQGFLYFQFTSETCQWFSSCRLQSPFWNVMSSAAAFILFLSLVFTCVLYCATTPETDTTSRLTYIDVWEEKRLYYPTALRFGLFSLERFLNVWKVFRLKGNVELYHSSW